jgi:hypothetical protein
MTPLTYIVSICRIFDTLEAAIEQFLLHFHPMSHEQCHLAMESVKNVVLYSCRPCQLVYHVVPASLAMSISCLLPFICSL